MNFVFVSPNFPFNYEHFVIQLRLQGFRVLGIGETPFHHLSPSLKSNLAYYYHVPSLNDYEAVYKGLAYFVYQYGRIDFLESHNEHWMELDARLRSDFNIFGLNQQTIPSIRSKLEMKKTFKKAKVPVAKGRQVRSLRNVLAFVKEVGYPIIIKPDRGVGASHTYKMTNKQDVEAFFSHKDDQVYLMEAFIDANIVTFDGLVDLDGNIVYYSSLVYNAPLLEIITDEKEVYFYAQRHLSDNFVQLGQRAVNAFNLKGRFFHMELFDLGNDQYIALELNCRPVGGYGLDVMNFANDIDLYQEYARIMARQPFSTEVDYPYFCGYVARRHTQHYQYSLDDISQRFPMAIVQVSPVPYVMSQLMGDMAIIVRHHDRETLLDITSQILALKTD